MRTLFDIWGDKPKYGCQSVPETRRPEHAGFNSDDGRKCYKLEKVTDENR